MRLGIGSHPTVGTSVERMQPEAWIKGSGSPGSEVRSPESGSGDSGLRTSDPGLPGASPLELRLLGPLEVRVHGEPLPPPRFRKAHWALALLALRAGREVDREWLAGTLWPESAAPQAFYNLRRCLSELRADLGDQADRLRAPTRRTLSLDLCGAWVDLIAFERALTRDEPASLEEAVALYRGP